MAVQFFAGSADGLVPDGEPLILNKGDAGYIEAGRIRDAKYLEACKSVYVHDWAFGFVAEGKPGTGIAILGDRTIEELVVAALTDTLKQLLNALACAGEFLAPGKRNERLDKALGRATASASPDVAAEPECVTPALGRRHVAMYMGSDLRPT